MRMRANDEISAAINQPTGEFALFISDSFAVFDSPVDEANDKIRAGPRFSNRGAKLGANRRRGDLAICFRVNTVHREQGDSFSIGQREKTRIASVPGWCFHSDWLNFFPNQVCCGIVQSHGAKIERMIICQSHCVKAGPAEQLRGLDWSAERITVCSPA